jgi:hypothetical protein
MIFFCGPVYFSQQVQKTMFIFFNHDLSRNPGWETLIYTVDVSCKQKDARIWKFQVKE